MTAGQKGPDLRRADRLHRLYARIAQHVNIMCNDHGSESAPTRWLPTYERVRAEIRELRS